MRCANEFCGRLLTILLILKNPPCFAAAPGDVDLHMRIEELVAEFESDVTAPQIEPVELTAKGKILDPGVVFVDVRALKERLVSTLPGALDLEKWERRAAAGPLPGRVVFYCTIGYRSSVEVSRISSVLAAKGSRALNLRGGILKWIAVGGEVVDPGGQGTDQVHVFGERWNVLPVGYVAHEYSPLRLVWEKMLWWLRGR